MIRARKEVVAFAELMESRLVLNDYKGGWKQCELLWLLSRLEEEVRELKRAVGEPLIGDDVASEAVDVANFAMMVADVCGGLGK